MAGNGRTGKNDFHLKTGGLRKDGKLMCRVPESEWDSIKRLLRENDLKFQEVFDYLVVNGVVFRDSGIMDFINRRKASQKKASSAEKVRRFDGKKHPRLKRKGKICLMYRDDLASFRQYCVDSNIAQQHIFNILLVEGFAKEKPVIMDLVRKCKAAGVSQRKKQVARLSDDEYILILSDKDSRDILSRTTKSYDSATTGYSIQEDLNEIMSESEMSEEDLADAELNRMISQKRKAKQKEIDRLTEPVDDE